MKRKYQTIIFDLDGTLLDTLADIVKAINSALFSIGITYKYSYEEGKKLIGSGALIMAKRALEPFKVSDGQKEFFLKQFLANYEKFQCESTKPFPCVLEGLETLYKNGYKLAIISNKPDFLTQQIVTKKLPIHLFIDVIGKRDDTKEKPYPDILLSLIQKNHLNADEVLYVGDSKIDVEFAVNGGVDVAILTYGYGNYEASLTKDATFVASNFLEIVNLLLG